MSSDKVHGSTQFKRGDMHEVAQLSGVPLSCASSWLITCLINSFPIRQIGPGFSFSATSDGNVTTPLLLNGNHVFMPQAQLSLAYLVPTSAIKSDISYLVGQRAPSPLP